MNVNLIVNLATLQWPGLLFSQLAAHGLAMEFEVDKSGFVVKDVFFFANKHDCSLVCEKVYQIAKENILKTAENFSCVAWKLLICAGTKLKFDIVQNFQELIFPLYNNCISISYDNQNFVGSAAG